MERIELRQISPIFDEDVYKMHQDIDQTENGFSNPAFGLSKEEYIDWLVKIDAHSRGEMLPEGWIPATTFVLFVGDVPVGYGRVRHSSSEYLETVLGVGNLGYGIAKSWRGKGYGSILFWGLLEECKKLGYKKINLFPMKTNIATIKIMQKFGGKIVGDFNDEKYKLEISL